METPVRPQHGLLTTRSAGEAAITSPPRKRRQRTVFLVGKATPKRDHVQQVGSTLPGVIFASDYQGPDFHFQGPQQPELPPSPPPPTAWFQNDDAAGAPMDISAEDVGNLLNNLLEAMTPPAEVEEVIEQPRRSSRTRIQTTYYQSDEIERHDKTAKEREKC